jgi:hypothetical protein
MEMLAAAEIRRSVRSTVYGWFLRIDIPFLMICRDQNEHNTLPNFFLIIANNRQFRNGEIAKMTGNYKKFTKKAASQPCCFGNADKLRRFVKNVTLLPDKR